MKFLSEGYVVYNGIKIYSEVYGEEQEYAHLVIGPNGVFCIETKYVSGDVTINSNGSWDVTSYGVSRTMDNPVQQVMRHSNLIKSILPEGIPSLSIIAMGNKKTKGVLPISYCRCRYYYIAVYSGVRECCKTK